MKLAGRQAPGGSPPPPPTPCLRWPRTSTPSPPGRHRVHGSLHITARDSGAPGGAQWQGQGRLGPQGVGAQESSPLSAPRPGHSAASGWDGPRVPGSQGAAGGVECSRWAGGGLARAGGVVSAHVPSSRPSSDPPSLSVAPHPRQYGWGGESQSWTEGRRPQGPRSGGDATLGAGFGKFGGQGFAGTRGGLMNGQGTPWEGGQCGGEHGASRKGC